MYISQLKLWLVVSAKIGIITYCYGSQGSGQEGRRVKKDRRVKEDRRRAGVPPAAPAYAEKEGRKAAEDNKHRRTRTKHGQCSSKSLPPL